MTKHRSIYDHTEDLLALEAMLEEHEGSSDEEVHAILGAWWTEQEGELADKVDRILALRAEAIGRASARDAEAQRLRLRANRDTRMAERMQRLVFTALDTLGLTRLETERYTVSIAKNGGLAPVLIVDPTAIPREFMTDPQPEPKRQEIAKALTAGVEVPGAALGERGRSLRIR